MSSLVSILVAVLPVFCVAGSGALMRRIEWLTEEADQSLMLMTVNFLIPAFIFFNILDNEALRDLRNVLVPPVVGFGTVMLGLGVGWLIRRHCGLSSSPERRTFVYSAGIYNYGYIPIPLALLLFGRETVGVLLVHNVGVEIALWTSGRLIFAVGNPREIWHKIFNPPVITILISLGLNFTGGIRLVPGFVMRTAEMLGNCAIPMGLVLIGAVMADHLGRGRSDWNWRVMAGAVTVRVGILPVLFLLLAAVLPISQELKRVMLLQAAMPAAVLPVLVSRLYGGDTWTALRVVVASTAASIITMPLWIQFGIWLLEA